MDGLPSLHPQAPCMQAHHLFFRFLLLRPQIMSLAGCLVLSLVSLKRQKPWRWTLLHVYCREVSPGQPGPFPAACVAWSLLSGLREELLTLAPDTLAVTVFLPGRAGRWGGPAGVQEGPEANATAALTTSGPHLRKPVFLLPLLRTGGETEAWSRGRPCLRSHRR